MRLLKRICVPVYPALALLAGSFAASTAFGQNASLSLSSGTAASNSASLNLTLSSSPGSAPAALQWTFTYSPASIVSISASPGLAAAASQKSLSCAGTSGTYTCLAWGLNANSISDGIVAVVNLAIVPGVTDTTIGVTNTLGASPLGEALAVTASGGRVTGGAPPLPSIGSLACLPGTLNSSQTSTCTVTMTSPAPLEGATVTLSRSASILTVPPTVTIPAGASTAAFSVTAGIVTADQGVTITATYNTSSATSSINLITPALISSLACNPTSIGPNSSSTCMVNLTKAPSGAPVVVALSTSNTTLTVPASILVPPSTSSVSFQVFTTTFRYNQAAIITASLQGSSANTTLSLTATAILSSLSCSPTNLSTGASSVCTIALNQPSIGSSAISLLTNNPNLTIPSGIVITDGNITGTFTASAANVITGNQTARISATLNGTLAATDLGLVASIAVSFLSCSPTDLGPGASTSCTINLSTPAPSGGAIVNISHNSAHLSLPANVVVNAGSSTIAFTAATNVIIPNDETVTVTATLGTTSATTTLHLTTPVLISSLACRSPNLGPGAADVCTVTLSKPAPGSGAAVFISSTSSSLIVPGSAVIAASQTSTSFNISTVANFSDQSVTITATYNGSSASSTINLTNTIQVSTLTCSPSTLSPSTATACTVLLTKNSPPGGATIMVTTSSSILSAPASTTIPADANSTTFTVQAGNFTQNGNGSVTVSYNGSSRSATVSLIATSEVISLVCAPASLVSGTVGSCTATLSQSATADLSLALSATPGTISVPSSVLIAAGTSSVMFNATIGVISSDTTGSITAILGDSSKTTPLTLWVKPALSSLTCTPTLMKAGVSSTCSVSMSRPTGVVTVNLSSTSSAALVPAAVTIPAGSASASFTVTTLSSGSGWSVVSAAYNEISKGLVITLLPASPNDSAESSLNRLICTPKVVKVGAHSLCQMILNPKREAPAAEVRVTSSSSSVQVPETMPMRPDQTMLEFQVDAITPGDDIEVAAASDSDAVKTTLTVADPSGIHVPGRQFAQFNRELRFRVSSSSPESQFSADGLPNNTYLDPITGEFSWSPDSSQAGSYQITFSANLPDGAKSQAIVDIQVEAGLPIVNSIVNAASRSADLVCSAGSIAAVQGRWLTDGRTVADRSGNSVELAGTKVWANGVRIPVLSASLEELNILCPDSLPGTQIEFVVETDHGSTPGFQTTARSAAPGLFSLDGSGEGQGLVLLKRSGRLAMVRNPRTQAQPAVPGEDLLVYATGIDNLINPSAQVGNQLLSPTSLSPVPGRPGVFEVTVALPGSIGGQGSIPVSLHGTSPEGTRISTNAMLIAVEPYDQ